jgi:hypothetical protein
MIMLINLKTQKSFIEICFSRNSKITKCILNILQISKNSPKNKLASIFCNMFLDEYKEIFVSNKIDDLFIFNNERFTKVNIEGLDILPKNFYRKLLRIIFDLNFTYEENLLKLMQTFDEGNLPISN